MGVLRNVDPQPLPEVACEAHSISSWLSQLHTNESPCLGEETVKPQRKTS